MTTWLIVGSHGLQQKENLEYYCSLLLIGNHGDLCVFGEKKSCIVKVDKNGLTATDRKIELKDWIWDAQFLNVCIILY
jgi:hypothetical protein